MDVAYDHTFQEEVAPTGTTGDEGKDSQIPKESLNEEFQQAYKAISASPWGTRFGAFIGSVKKQGETVYESSKKEYGPIAQQASKGLNEFGTTLVNRTRGLSISQLSLEIASPRSASKAPASALPHANSKQDAVENDEGLLSKLRKGAAQRISEMEAAEARADEYLAKFGSNIGSFLRDAVTIVPPDLDKDGHDTDVVFETKASIEGGKKIFTTRLDAQLHLLHIKHDLFATDPDVPRFESFANSFSVDEITQQISSDLDKYPELRSTMEILVPADVQYTQFWTRYYFLRSELDLEEKKRKDLLKGASAEEEEIGWDEEEDDLDEQSNDKDTLTNVQTKSPTQMLQPKPETLDPKVSTDRTSQPDSESSYDVVSSDAPKSAQHTTDSSTKVKVCLWYFLKNKRRGLTSTVYAG
ncbi:hypothetical protein EDC01DRAFT_622691 [Geopyxis carbonaria]|nr:hypothetical protein EDC01DRAFT_622691 [Geopyxis carbonaria]